MAAYSFYNMMYPSTGAATATSPTVVNPYMSYQSQGGFPNFGQNFVYPAGGTFTSQEGCFVAPNATGPATSPGNPAPLPSPHQQQQQQQQQLQPPPQQQQQQPLPPQQQMVPQAQVQVPLVYPPGPMCNGSFPQIQQYPPPPTHQLPDKQFLWSVFQRVNRDKSGNISASELQSALSNGTWKAFNPDTVRLMIGMFGHSTRNKVNFEEFCNLWKYVTDWLNYFQMFDQDCSGNIDKAELKVALMNFGYRLTDKFYKLLILKFDRDMKGAINFDDFIHCCVILQALTGAFRNHDMDQDGWVRMTYEQFLMVVFRLRL